MNLSRLYEGNFRVSSVFGPRILENGDSNFHKGMDCVGIESKNIITPTNGKIITSQIITDKHNVTWEWGNYVKMDDLNGYYLFFCHLSKRAVTAGDYVKKGQLVGVEGQTGYALGNHLHFEVRRKIDGISIDPYEYFTILENWEKTQVENAKKFVREKTGFSDGTIEYLSKYQYSDDLFLKLYDAMR